MNQVETRSRKFMLLRPQLEMTGKRASGERTCVYARNGISTSYSGRRRKRSHEMPTFSRLLCSASLSNFIGQSVKNLEEPMSVRSPSPSKLGSMQLPLTHWAIEPHHGVVRLNSHMNGTIRNHMHPLSFHIGLPRTRYLAYSPSQNNSMTRGLRGRRHRRDAAVVDKQGPAS